MALFNEHFYTNDFDQEMLDWIKCNLKISPYPSEWDVSHTNLKYASHKSISYFWTSSDFTKDRKLTKQEFKEKIGMPAKQFTKDALQNGMLVEYRSGELRMVWDGKLLDMYFNIRAFLYNYNNLLVGESGEARLEEFDIVAVYKHAGSLPGSFIKGDIIWQREPEECPMQKQLDELYKQIDELKAKADTIKKGG